MDSFDRLLDSGKVARFLGVEAETLGAWRRKGYGPRWYRIGRKIKYSEADLRGWMNTRIHSLDTQITRVEVERHGGEAMASSADPEEGTE